MTLECGGAGKRLRTLIATEALHNLSFFTRMDGEVHFKPFCTPKPSPTEFTGVRRFSRVYSHVTRQVWAPPKLHATQFTAEFFTRGL